jgi:hypothetical protein
MQPKLFVLPIKNLEAAEAEMNGFLRGHRVLAVKREFVADGENSFRQPERVAGRTLARALLGGDRSCREAGSSSIVAWDGPSIRAAGACSFS